MSVMLSFRPKSATMYYWVAGPLGCLNTIPLGCRNALGGDRKVDG